MNCKQVVLFAPTKELTSIFRLDILSHDSVKNIKEPAKHKIRLKFSLKKKYFKALKTMSAYSKG